MASKEDLINNLRVYTPDQIVEAIKAKTVTVYELSKSGNLTPLMRRRIEEKLASTVTEKEQTLEETTEPEINSEVQGSLNTNEDDSIEIPEASDDDYQSEITVAESPVVSATAEPPISSSNQTSNAYNYETPSNKGMFKRPFSFNGRIRRMEYGITFIIYFIWYMIINGVTVLGNVNEGTLIFCLITIIPMMWFLLAQSCKRCHDRGNSGWYQLIPFYSFVLLFGDGEEGSNDYGDNPKE